MAKADGELPWNASSMAVGVCKDGLSVGVDLHDETGKTIAHGHMDAERAMEFLERFSEAVEELINRQLRPH